jgi:hypothetical protein
VSVHDLDPQPDLRLLAKRYSGGARIPAAAWLEFELQMEQWYCRRSMSWGSSIDCRSRKPARFDAYAATNKDRRQ